MNSSSYWSAASFIILSFTSSFPSFIILKIYINVYLFTSFKIRMEEKERRKRASGEWERREGETMEE